ncbi:hypothetical protein PSEUBRA_001340 [Kalmanozyma brasiliensis GHG001]|uniref:Uncharacterized protein n=1 Tax=Kalmanozyma brasiliensis (strain GHG001) TaxID=1365824 RepID=V5EES0_KALBG|nr:uncharacterized protein PSEUBRA_001340 [Kalmanozyma brasiliensis GHG001]EST09011.1 hypothetical protein PSEUBRA_001340 [Kalmanozyma brasiliensis GHG001]
MDEAGAVLCGGCCGAICAQIQYAFCNTRQYGTDATCADNCCRFNCCWKQGAFPVEDYPIANSEAQDRTQTVDSSAATKGEGGQLPAYTATPQMSAAPATGSTPAPAVP